MCQFKSALCLKDRVFVPDYDSHDRMLKDLGIPDDYIHASKTFVRVELSPADGNPASDPMGWRIRIDQDILPDWFDHKVDELRVKEAITEWCKVHVLREGTHEVRDGVWIAYGSATVKAYDSATVILPKLWQTDQPVKLNGEAIGINHKTHTIRSAIKWQQEDAK